MTQAMQAAPATGPNHPPVQQTPEHDHLTDQFEFLLPENITAMREEQKKVRAEVMQGVNYWDAQARREAEARATELYADVRRDYLLSFDSMKQYADMDPSDPSYVDYEKFDTYLIGASINVRNDDEWSIGEFDADGNQLHPSGKEIMQDLHDQEVADAEAASVLPPLDIPPNNDETQYLFTPDQLRDYTDKVEARNTAHAALLLARDALAELTVARQGKLRDSQSPEYRDAHAAYNDALIAYARAGEAMKDAADPRRTDDERKADVTAYLLFEATELRRSTNEKWDNKTVNKICKWMASGNFAQRALKGMLVGGGAAATAALITAATAGTGVGAAAGALAAGGTMLSRGMRAYGAVRGREVSAGNQATTMTGTEQDIRASIDAMFAQDVYADIDTATRIEAGLDLATHRLHEGHERAIQAEQKKNRRATLMGIGAIAFGAGTTFAATEAVSHFGGWTDKLHDLLGGDDHPSGSVKKIEVAPDAEAPGVEETLQPAPTTPNAIDHVTAEQYGAMATIDKGMGGIALFNEMGLSAKDWYANEDALLSAHPGDFYRMSDGHVGLKHTGKLSEDAMRDIAHRTGIWKK